MKNNRLDKWMSEANFFIICVWYESIKFSIEDILTWWCMIDISSHRILYNDLIFISAKSTHFIIILQCIIRQKTLEIYKHFSRKLLIYKLISHIVHSAIISENHLLISRSWPSILRNHLTSNLRTRKCSLKLTRGDSLLHNSILEKYFLFILREMNIKKISPKS